MQNKILITGGSGFIGTNYINFILKNKIDVQVFNLDKITYAGNFQNHDIFDGDDRYTFVHGDILDSNIVDDLVKKVDLIVNFAAETHVDRSIVDPLTFLKTNVLGTQVLLDSALKNGMKRFHHISTDEVFGSLELDSGEKFSEVTPYAPRSPYAASKAASDHIVRSYHHTYGLPVTISNCSNNYGPYQHTEKMIPLFITNLMKGIPVPVYGTGVNVRDWLHVEDHVSAIDKIVNEGIIGETYCVGGDNELSNLDIVKMLLTEFGMNNDMVSYVPDRLGHDLRYAVDFTKIKNELGWKPAHSFIGGLKETIGWYKKNEEWWQALKK